MEFLKAFFGDMDFFEGVAELVGTEQNDSMNAATVDMVTPTAI